jgi:hypothetical protein
MATSMDTLTHTAFENLTYDLVSAAGLKNLVWRTPGSDGGRDIEGIAFSRDLSGQDLVQKWYVECKRYAASLDWPTVWEKIAYAEVQGADVLLIATNSNPSPQCETQVSEWNRNLKRPVIRFWRGYEFAKLLRTHSDVAASYGLTPSNILPDISAIPLAVTITKFCQAAYAAKELGVSCDKALEAASILSELLSQRLDDLQKYGRFVKAAPHRTQLSFDWLEANGTAQGWEEVALRALVASYRYIFNAESLRVELADQRATITPIKRRLKVDDRAIAELRTIAFWARAEIANADPETGVLIFEQRD